MMKTRTFAFGRLLLLAIACAALASPASAEAPSLSAPAGADAPPKDAAAAQPEAAAPLQLTVQQAIVLALKNNRSLIVDSYNPQIARTAVEQQIGVFDPDLTGQLLFVDSSGRSLGATGFGSQREQNLGLQLGVSQFSPSGTTFALTAGTTTWKFTPGETGRYVTDVNLSVTQSILRGYGADVNLASVRQAILDTKSSQFELRGFAEALVAQIEETYWDYKLAQEQIKIVEKSLKLAQDQLDETRERIRLGRLAATELVAADAELALRREDAINARSAFETTRLQLLRLLSPEGDAFEHTLDLTDQPAAPGEALDELAEHLQAAQRFRPDLNQARLLVLRGDLEIVKTRNGLLPKLDLFITLGRTGYSTSFRDSLRQVSGGNYVFTTGLNFDYPVGNHAAKALDTRATLTREQSKEAVDNLSQLVEVDVRSAFIEIQRSREQVAATAASRKLQAEKERVEMEKLKLEKSTALLVAQASRDLLAAEIAEVQARVNYRKALTELYRLEGTLLLRRNLDTAGAAPPDAASRPAY